jgi:hypothetical protein
VADESFDQHLRFLRNFCGSWALEVHCQRSQPEASIFNVRSFTTTAPQLTLLSDCRTKMNRFGHRQEHEEHEPNWLDRGFPRAFTRPDSGDLIQVLALPRLWFAKGCALSCLQRSDGYSSLPRSGDRFNNCRSSKSRRRHLTQSEGRFGASFSITCHAHVVNPELPCQHCDPS